MRTRGSLPRSPSGPVGSGLTLNSSWVSWTGAARRAARRHDLRRQGVLLQFRRRGLRGRHQAGAALPLRTGQARRWRIITFNGAFHGRTLATIAAAGNEKHLEGFGPPADGFDHVAFGDLDAVERAIGAETGGIMVEPIQGEGGINVADPVPAGPARELCDRTGCC